MSLLGLTLRYLRAQGAGALLNVLLLALGTATIVVVLIASHQLGNRLQRDAAGVDLVIGAKGSPMQLILSTLYQADVPTGNIPLADARPFATSPMVDLAIPLALGDSHAGLRIVGSTLDYAALYDARLAGGRWWAGPMEAVLGAGAARAAGLDVGDRFVGSHGLGGSGALHEDTPYTVTGVLAPTASVLDRLILVDVRTVWQVHAPHHPGTREAADAQGGRDVAHAPAAAEGHGHEHDAVAAGGRDGAHGHAPAAAEGHGHDHDAVAAGGRDGAHAHAPAAAEGHGHDHGPGEAAARDVTPATETGEADGATAAGFWARSAARSGPESAVTAVLVRYRSPLAAALMPRQVNARSALQAASPAFETARLLNLVGIGFDALRALAGVLVAVAALGIFIALYNALSERRYDLALMRVLGASPGRLFGQLLLEGALLALAGGVLGLLLGHLAAGALGLWLPRLAQLGLHAGAFAPAEPWVLPGAVLAGLLAALLPAWRAARTDIAGTLSQTR